MTELDPSATETLNGWKEIAAYVGKSVRSAQRWEREIGLPVHRIATPEGGQIIYASRCEIDAWRQQLTVPPNDFAAGLDDLPGDGSELSSISPESIDRTTTDDSLTRVASVPADLPRPLVFRVRYWAAGFLLGAVTGAVAIAIVLAPSKSGVAQFEVSGHEVRALTDSNRTVWAHSFGRAVHRSAHSRVVAVQGDPGADGTSNVYVSVRFAAPGAQSEETDAAVAFDADGKMLWRVQPDFSFTDGQRTFEAPWHLRDIAVSRGVHPERVWLAYTHHTWRPGFVVEVAPNGDYTLRYVQEGATRALTYWPTPSGTYLAVGGAMNEFARASVAFIGVDDPPARPPLSTDPGLTCATCPQGSVRALFLLAPSEVLRALFRPYGEVTAIQREGDTIRANVDEGIGAGSVVRFGPSLTATQYDRSDRYWQAHREMERDGRIAHAVEHCPETTTARIVRLWTREEGWKEYPVPTTIPPITATH